MADEVAKSPQQVFDEKFAAEEALRKSRVDYDPKVHGAGTQPMVAPESVVELHKVVVALEARIKRLEGGGRRQ
jgi:hypothetical protein